MQPTNPFVTPLLTDQYQLTMAYAYWQNGRHEEPAVFDLFFRKNPFGGEFTIFAGLSEVLRHVQCFWLKNEHLNYLRKIMPGCEEEFFSWLGDLRCNDVKIYAVHEGTLVFPAIPLLRVEGPLAVVQLLETTLLNLVNFPSLVATNAARFRLAAGKDKTMIEFGVRRAQGPDGGVSASRYSYLGGFDATSNLLAGKLFDIPVRGTHAHSFIQSFSGLEDLHSRMLIDNRGKIWDFVDQVLRYREQLGFQGTNESELAAFIAYAQAFPNGFLALVDTYDTLKSGVPNFLCVALALHQFGYKPIGIRLDSGDLAYLSKKSRKLFRQAIDQGLDNRYFEYLTIVASNDIDEETLLSLNQQGHEVDSFGIGTHLVTCKAQPALGCVYKLVQVNDTPKIKLSEQTGKVTIPGRKEVHRLVGKEGYPLIDLIIQVGEQPPKAGESVLCRHPFDETKRANVIPSKVIPLHQLVWDGKEQANLPTLEESRQYVLDQLALFRPDHLRSLNPTSYKVSVSPTLYDFIHTLWQSEAPITQLS